MRNVVDKIANRIRWGYLTAFILLLSSYILTFYTTKQLLAQADLVNNTNNTILNLETVLSDLKDAETGIRGFYLSNDERFLQPYKGSHERVEDKLNKISEYLSKKSDHKEHFDTLIYLVQRKYELMEAGMNVHVADSLLTDTSRKLILEGKSIMDRIRQKIAKIEEVERAGMQGEKQKLTAFSRSIKAINIASLIVAVLLAFYAIITFNKENNGRREADASASAFREQLELRITELDKANKELVELRSQEKFAATGRISRTIAHEVRNPLTNINLAAEHLKSEIEKNPEVEILLEMITRNANRINILISDLLNSTRAAHLSFESYSINKLLDESLDLAEDRIQLNNIKVEKKYSPGICDIQVDPEKVRFAFLNIIVNAIEAMDPDQGRLQLVTEMKDNKCIVVIEDNGKGMDKENLSRLFEPYFTTKETGNGLGLTNTHNIILNHKGNIFGESELGKGTKITITFNS